MDLGNELHHMPVGSLDMDKFQEGSCEHDVMVSQPREETVHGARQILRRKHLEGYHDRETSIQASSDGRRCPWSMSDRPLTSECHPDVCTGKLVSNIHESILHAVNCYSQSTAGCRLATQMTVPFRARLVVTQHK